MPDMRGWGLFLFAGGAGALVGAVAGRDVMPFAIAAAVVGLVMLVAGSVSRSGADLIEDAKVPRQAGRADRSDRPTLAGLGTRVEDILRLAEEQADDHRAEAKREADAIIAAAKAEAQRIHPG
ncbi:hypothetical protein Q0Z83_032850 [Actinoplanes sichuanensis]|nr:hypothetical protein Q0Z83_032850 [Actinoplanes sichuanensis]